MITLLWQVLSSPVRSNQGGPNQNSFDARSVSEGITFAWFFLFYDRSTGTSYCQFIDVSNSNDTHTTESTVILLFWRRFFPLNLLFVVTVTSRQQTFKVTQAVMSSFKFHTDKQTKRVRKEQNKREHLQLTVNECRGRMGEVVLTEPTAT